MRAPIITTIVAGAITLAGGSYFLEIGVAAARMHNLTADVQNCRVELAADFGFTGGHRTQAQASAEVAACQISQGTTLTVQVAPDGYEFTIIGTITEAPGYTATMKTAAGGAIVVTRPAE